MRELERGQASWYGLRFHGRRTASGDRYDQRALTAAHKTLPFGTMVRVRSLVNGKEIEVRINDRGPFVRGRVVDVSLAAAEALGMMAQGVNQVSLHVAASDLVRSNPVTPTPAKNQGFSSRTHPVLLADSVLLDR
jgi:rare lipoprotein A